MKLIYFFNIATKHYVIFAHNLTDADAENEIVKLRKMGYPAMSAPQEKLHAVSECLECKDEIERIMNNATGIDTDNKDNFSNN